MKRKLTMMLLCMAVTVTAWAQTAITGTVVSVTDNEPIIGATVKVKGAAKGVVTNIDGKFTIDVQAGKTLVVSYVGMQTVEAADSRGCSTPEHDCQARYRRGYPRRGRCRWLWFCKETRNYRRFSRDCDI